MARMSSSYLATRVSQIIPRVCEPLKMGLRSIVLFFGGHLLEYCYVPSYSLSIARSNGKRQSLYAEQQETCFDDCGNVPSCLRILCDRANLGYTCLELSRHIEARRVREVAKGVAAEMARWIPCGLRRNLRLAQSLQSLLCRNCCLCFAKCHPFDLPTSYLFPGIMHLQHGPPEGSIPRQSFLLGQNTDTVSENVQPLRQVFARIFIKLTCSWWFFERYTTITRALVILNTIVGFHSTAL